MKHYVIKDVKRNLYYSEYNNCYGFFKGLSFAWIVDEDGSPDLMRMMAQKVEYMKYFQERYGFEKPEDLQIVAFETKEEVVEPYEAINVVGNHWKERMGMKPRDMEEEQKLFEGYRKYFQLLRERGEIK